MYCMQLYWFVSLLTWCKGAKGEKAHPAQWSPQCASSPRPAWAHPIHDFPSVQNPTAALQVTLCCPLTFLRHLSTLWVSIRLLFGIFLLKRFSEFEVSHKTMKMNQKHGHGQLPVTHLTWDKWLILAQLYLTNLIFHSLCFAKGRQMVSQPTTKTWKKKKVLQDK